MKSPKKFEDRPLWQRWAARQAMFWAFFICGMLFPVNEVRLLSAFAAVVWVLRWGTFWPFDVLYVNNYVEVVWGFRLSSRRVRQDYVVIPCHIRYYVLYWAYNVVLWLWLTWPSQGDDGEWTLTFKGLHQLLRWVIVYLGPWV